MAAKKSGKKVAKGRLLAPFPPLLVSTEVPCTWCAGHAGSCRTMRGKKVAKKPLATRAAKKPVGYSELVIIASQLQNT